jgi:hypothetical protein
LIRNVVEISQLRDQKSFLFVESFSWFEHWGEEPT